MWSNHFKWQCTAVITDQLWSLHYIFHFDSYYMLVVDGDEGASAYGKRVVVEFLGIHSQRLRWPSVLGTVRLYLQSFRSRFLVCPSMDIMWERPVLHYRKLAISQSTRQLKIRSKYISLNCGCMKEWIQNNNTPGSIEPRNKDQSSRKVKIIIH